jgi:hypothetical protein
MRPGDRHSESSSDWPWWPAWWGGAGRPWPLDVFFAKAGTEAGAPPGSLEGCGKPAARTNTT